VTPWRRTISRCFGCRSSLYGLERGDRAGLAKSRNALQTCPHASCVTGRRLDDALFAPPVAGRRSGRDIRASMSSAFRRGITAHRRVRPGRHGR
jgi:hypothetical protein